MSAILWKIIKSLILLYLIYVLVGGLLIFYVTSPKAAKPQAAEFQETSESIALIDDVEEAWQARVDLISRARETLDISYYALHGGETIDEFLGLIIDAANRGVKVRFMLDGIAHGLWLKPSLYKAIAQHPNIDFAYYEPLNLLMPISWHHRLHDKIILVDNEIAMMGGRNIGDKYFTHQTKSTSIDRDVILFPGADGKHVLIQQISDYFNQLWTSPHNFVQGPEYTDSTLAQTSQFQLELAQEAKQSNPGDPSLKVWRERAVPIHRGYLISNPLKRGFNEPTVWSNMLYLMQQAEDNILVQSPYVIPSSQMRADLKFNHQEFADVDINLLSNSLASSNNILANSGYQNNRQAILEQGIHLYEFQPREAQLHTKAIVIDERISAVGTFNIDSRSTYLNTESMLVIDSPEFTAELLDDLRTRYDDQIEAISPAGEDPSAPPFFKKFLVTILRPLATLFTSLL